MTNPVLFFLSWLIVAFGQPARSTVCAALAGVIGYALFWQATKKSPSRFRIAFVWFALVQGVQLFWMTASTYQGSYIYFCYIGISLWLAAQFGALNLCMPKRQMTVRAALGIAGLWTLVEWSRYHILCGFAFNPAGLALAANPLSLQMVSLFGVLGLTFWLMMTNLFAMRTFENMKAWPFWVIAAIFPYVFGAIHTQYHSKKIAQSPSKMVTLVQTGLLPDEKNFFQQRADTYVHPFLQWKRILQALPTSPGMIVLPEAVIPYSYNAPIFPLDTVSKLLRDKWGNLWVNAVPPLEMPYAQERNGVWYVSHAFWTQAIANYYNVEVIGGFDVEDESGACNAAIHCFPNEGAQSARYNKRVLVPLAEYLPLKALSNLVANFGIIGEFEHGKEAVVSGEKEPVSFSICYEECFGHLMREGRQKGAKLFVNVTNDGWFSFSKLPIYHLEHSRPRTVENGVPLVRASNTGGTAVIDSLGRTVVQTKKCYTSEVITSAIPMYTFKTLYTICGDWVIVALAALAAAQYCLVLKRCLR